MKKSLLEIYALAVCFFAVATFLIIGGQAAWDIVEFSAPGLTINSHEWSRHQSDETYRDWLIERNRCCKDNAERAPIPEGQALTVAREKSYAQELTSHRRAALQSLVENLLILLIAVAAFVIHWRIAARARQSAS